MPSMPIRIITALLALPVAFAAGAGSAHAEPMYITADTPPAEWFSDLDVEALARIVAAEARGDTDEAQRGVVRVILNRLYSPLWPDDLYDVIAQPGQFSAYLDDNYFTRIIELRVFENVLAVLEGDDPFGGDAEVQFFRSRRTKHKWDGTRRKHVVDIGDTAFFK